MGKKIIFAILILSAPLLAEDQIQFRVGARFGSYGHSFTLSSRAHIGSFSLYSHSTVYQFRSTLSGGLRFNAKRFSVGGYFYKVNDHVNLNFDSSLRLTKSTYVRASFQSASQVGYLYVSQRIADAMISVRGSVNKSGQWQSGEFSIDFPITISLEKKRKKAPSERRAVHVVIPAGSVEGVVQGVEKSVLVQLESKKHRTRSGMTDTYGNFKFENVRTGIWQLKVRTLPPLLTAAPLKVTVKDKRLVKVIVKTKPKKIQWR